MGSAYYIGIAVVAVIALVGFYAIATTLYSGMKIQYHGFCNCTLGELLGIDKLYDHATGKGRR